MATAAQAAQSLINDVIVASKAAQTFLAKQTPTVLTAEAQEALNALEKATQALESNAPAILSAITATATDVATTAATVSTDNVVATVASLVTLIGQLQTDLTLVKKLAAAV